MATTDSDGETDDNGPTQPEAVELVLENTHSESSPGVIIGAVTATESISTSLLNLDYPVFAVIALSFWNLLFIGIVLFNLKINHDLIKMIEELEWLPIFAALAVIANMVLLFTTKTVEKLGSILLFLLFLLSFIALITLVIVQWDILTQIHKDKCYSMKNSVQECRVTFWCLAVAGAINYRVVDDGPLAGETFQFKTLDTNGNHRGEKRIVKLGRKWLVKGGCCCCFAHHWAVQVVDNESGNQVAEKADFWYEVDHKETLFALPKIRINKAKNKQRRMFMPCLPCCQENNESTKERWHSCLPWYNEPSAEMGCFDERDAGCCGGEIVGKTRMTDAEIEVFYENWSKEKRYFVATTNCIKFAYEIIEKLTDGKFLIAHSTVVAANISENSHIGGTCIKWGEGHGTFLSRRGAGDTRFTLGLFGLRCRFGPEFKAHFLAGRSGLGFFLNLSCNRVELSFGWPWIGGDVHADINLNTGLGARNGNVELHVLGFGGKVGTDGIEINTPWYGGSNLGSTSVWLLLFYLWENVPKYKG